MHCCYIVFLEQTQLFEEYIDHCMPSIYMSKPTFAQYMIKKGLKDERIDDLFRYVQNRCIKLEQ